jgi:hypothetical protein
VLAQDPVPEAAYYKEIQTGSAPLAAEVFAKLGADAASHPAATESLLPLVKAYAATTERVWAVVYGEVYLDLLKPDAPRNGVDVLVFGLYDDAITLSDKGFNISLTKQAVVDVNDANLPFNVSFEAAFTLGCVVPREGGKGSIRPGLEPLTLQSLTEIRRAQLSMWQDKKFPTTELIRWQQRVEQAGHWEAYNQWLFGAARPEEAAKWLDSHKQAQADWTAWKLANPLKVVSADFLRRGPRPSK